MNKSDKVLINFYIDKSDKVRFDDVCRLSGKTRTHVLVDLVRIYVVETCSKLDERFREMNQIDELLGTYHEYQEKQKRLSDEMSFELPPSMYVWDGQEPDVLLNF